MKLIDAKKWLALAGMFLFTVCLVGGAVAEEAAKVTGGLDIGDKFKPGQQFNAALNLKIAEGFHINSDSAQNPAGMPMSVTLEADDILELNEVIYPKALRVKLEFSEEPVPVFEGKLVLKLQLKVAQDAAKGTYKGKLIVEYQGCDDKMCHMPELLEITFEYMIE